MSERVTKRLVKGGLLGSCVAPALLVTFGAICGYAGGTKMFGSWGGGSPPGTFQAAYSGALLVTLAFGLPVAGIGLAVGAAIAYRTRSRSR